MRREITRLKKELGGAGDVWKQGGVAKSGCALPGEGGRGKMGAKSVREKKKWGTVGRWKVGQGSRGKGLKYGKGVAVEQQHRRGEMKYQTTKKRCVKEERPGLWPDEKEKEKLKKILECKVGGRLVGRQTAGRLWKKRLEPPKYLTVRILLLAVCGKDEGTGGGGGEGFVALGRRGLKKVGESGDIRIISTGIWVQWDKSRKKAV